MPKLRWGILATGAIARAFAEGLRATQRGSLVAVGSRSGEKAREFASAFPGATPHPGYTSLLADEEVDAVYIATPHPHHAEWAIRAAEAKKHVLCEKPLGLNHAEAMAIVEAARSNGVFLMEAFMYRTHPQIDELVRLLGEQAIGEVRHIRTSFGFQAPFNAESRLFKNALGGGGILDVGCYPVSLARLAAGAGSGEPFLEPDAVDGHGALAETGVDRWAAALLKFPGGISAQIATSISLGLDSEAVIYGSRGRIRIPQPFLPSGRGSGAWEMQLEKRGEAPQLIQGETEVGLYTLEADHVAEQIAAGRSESQRVSWEDSLGNARALDAWRRAVGVAYEAEQPDRLVRPVHGRALERRPDASMRYGKVPGVDRQVSRLLAASCSWTANCPLL